jgi:hypothetical protein
MVLQKLRTETGASLAYSTTVARKRGESSKTKTARPLWRLMSLMAKLRQRRKLASVRSEVS